jgi:hypothetical protein
MVGTLQLNFTVNRSAFGTTDLLQQLATDDHQDTNPCRAEAGYSCHWNLVNPSSIPLLRPVPATYCSVVSSVHACGIRITQSCVSTGK